METQTTDLNFYDIVFKTIYLFLEANDFQESAATFLAEIRERYHKELDLRLVHPKTLVLRPICDTPGTSEKQSDCSSIQLIFNIPEDDEKSVSIHENEYSTKSKSRSIHTCNSVDINCPDCQMLAKTEEELQHFCQFAISLIDENDIARCNWKHLYTLGESIEALRDEHRKMIALISGIKMEICSLTAMDRSIIMSRCGAQVNEIFSYPGSHLNAVDLKDLMLDADELTEDQVESSAINSSRQLSNANDLTIPLKGKSNVGDIPQLIYKGRNYSQDKGDGGNNVLVEETKSGSGTTFQHVDEDGTTVMFSFRERGANEVLLDAGQKRDEYLEVEMDFNINWCELKKSMFADDVQIKLKLLQALRWRLTQPESARRDRHLLEIVEQDILSINSIQPCGQLFLESFFCPKKIKTPCASQEEMARFLNTLASLSMGRLYLERDENILSVMILPLIMNKLPGIQISSTTRSFAIAVVQKLSLSNKIREVIISSGTVEWLVQFIVQQHASQSAYEAEYSVALLTNLCINKEARRRSERIADRVVALLFHLIDTPQRCCIKYINALLFSLLLNPHINETAIAQGIDLKLKRLQKVFRFDEMLLRQFDAIKQMHEARDFCECDDCDIAAASNQRFIDYTEPELNANEETYAPPLGEELLKTFCITGESEKSTKQDVIKQLSSVHIVQNDQLPKKCDDQAKHSTNLQKVERTISKSIASQGIAIEATAAQRVYAAKFPKTIPAKMKKVANNKSQLRVPPLKQTMTLRNKAVPKVDTRWNRESPKAQIAKKFLPSKQPSQRYVVNCCYKMDYANAIAAPPGEFIPHLETEGDTRGARETCECIKNMQAFVDNVQHTKDTSTETSTEPMYVKYSRKVPEGARQKNDMKH